MINKDVFDQLRQTKRKGLVSIYIPTHIAGDYEANRIRWKNSIKEAQSKLEKFGLNEEEIKKTLRPAKMKIDNYDFWAHRSLGLAGFFSPTSSTFIDLAFTPAERVIVGSEHLTYPMLPTILNKQRLFVLTLSLKKVRFFEVHKNAIFPVEISDLIPTNLEELELMEKSDNLQHHSVRGSETHYHGQGERSDLEEKRISQFFRYIDDGLKPIFRDENVPLVLVGLKQNQSIYRDINSYHNLIDQSIDINPDHSDPVAIHSEVLPLFEELVKNETDSIMDKFNASLHSEMATKDYTEINEAINMNNVDTLIINTYNSSEEDNELSKNKLILKALDQGAELIFLEQDDDVTFRAIFRYKLITE